MKAQYETFIKEMVKHGDENKAVLKAYPHLKTKKDIRTYCRRLSNNVEISAAIQQKSQKIKELATKEAIQELKEEIKVEMLDVTQKRNLLFKIATGLHDVEEVLGYKEKVGAEGKISFQIIRTVRKPTPYEIAKAIELDNKMSGDNAPTKVAQTDTKGKDLPKYEKLSTEDLNTLLTLERKAAGE